MTDHSRLDSLTGASSLEKTDSYSLSSHWLTVALHVEVGTCEIAPTLPAVKWGYHCVGVVVFMVMNDTGLSFFACNIAVTSFFFLLSAWCPLLSCRVVCMTLLFLSVKIWRIYWFHSLDQSFYFWKKLLFQVCLFFIIMMLVRVSIFIWIYLRAFLFVAHFLILSESLNLLAIAKLIANWHQYLSSPSCDFSGGKQARQ